MALATSAESEQDAVVDADARKAILDAAVAVIETKGLASVSMREVARLAGVSHQLPYHYFADREGILAAIAATGFELLGAQLETVIDGPGTGAEKLEIAGRVYVEFACSRPAHFRVMFRNDFVALDCHPAVEKCANECFAKIPLLIGQLVGEGLTPHPDETALVLLAWSLAHGLATLILDGPLAKTKPVAAEEREATIAAVMSAMRFLIETASKKIPAKKR